MINRTYQGKPILVIAFLIDFKAHIQANTDYYQSYKDLFRVANQTFSVFIVEERDYQRSGVFSCGRYFDGKKLVAYKYPVQAKVVFYRGYKLRGGKDWAVMNNARLNSLCKNKHRAYKKFQSFYKPTYWFKNRAQLVANLKRIKTQLVVYKPLRGSFGKNVVINSTNRILPLLKHVKSGLLQDFIDTSAGIVGICKGTHDLRVVIMNGKICEAIVHTPKKNKLIANWAGGSIKEIAINKIPSAALVIVRAVDKYMKRFGPRMYSVDMGFEKGKPYIIELNRGPALPYKDLQPMHYWRWNRELLSTLKAALRRVS